MSITTAVATGDGTLGSTIVSNPAASSSSSSSSTLPSIRSLRNKFQALSGGGGSSNVTVPPSSTSLSSSPVHAEKGDSPSEKTLRKNGTPRSSPLLTAPKGTGNGSNTKAEMVRAKSVGGLSGGGWSGIFGSSIFGSSSGSGSSTAVPAVPTPTPVSKTTSVASAESIFIADTIASTNAVLQRASSMPYLKAAARPLPSVVVEKSLPLTSSVTEPEPVSSRKPFRISGDFARSMDEPTLASLRSVDSSASLKSMNNNNNSGRPLSFITNRRSWSASPNPRFSTIPPVISSSSAVSNELESGINKGKAKVLSPSGSSTPLTPLTPPSNYGDGRGMSNYHGDTQRQSIHVNKRDSSLPLAFKIASSLGLPSPTASKPPSPSPLSASVGGEEHARTSITHNGDGVNKDDLAYRRLSISPSLSTQATFSGSGPTWANNNNNNNNSRRASGIGGGASTSSAPVPPDKASPTSERSPTDSERDGEVGGFTEAGLVSGEPYPSHQFREKIAATSATKKRPISIRPVSLVRSSSGLSLRSLQPNGDTNHRPLSIAMAHEELHGSGSGTDSATYLGEMSPALPRKSLLHRVYSSDAPEPPSKPSSPIPMFTDPSSYGNVNRSQPSLSFDKARDPYALSQPEQPSETSNLKDPYDLQGEQHFLATAANTPSPPPSAAMVMTSKSHQRRSYGLGSPLDDLMNELGGRMSQDSTNSISSAKVANVPRPRGLPALPSVSNDAFIAATGGANVVRLSDTAKVNRMGGADDKTSSRHNSLGLQPIDVSPVGEESEKNGVLPQPKRDVIVSDQNNVGHHETSLTLDQMRREVARMEAELMLNGERRSMSVGSQRRAYTPSFRDDSSTGATLSRSPTPSRIVATSTSTHTASASTLLTSQPGEAGTEGSQNQVFTPRNLEEATFTSHRFANDAQSSASMSVSSSGMGEEEGSGSTGGLGSEITPKSARRWSIVEVEKAYERMKEMLNSTTSKRQGERSVEKHLTPTMKGQGEEEGEEDLQALPPLHDRHENTLDKNEVVSAAAAVPETEDEDTFTQASSMRGSATSLLSEQSSAKSDVVSSIPGGFPIKHLVIPSFPHDCHDLRKLETSSQTASGKDHTQPTLSIPIYGNLISPASNGGEDNGVAAVDPFHPASKDVEQAAEIINPPHPALKEDEETIKTASSSLVQTRNSSIDSRDDLPSVSSPSTSVSLENKSEAMLADDSTLTSESNKSKSNAAQHPNRRHTLSAPVQVFEDNDDVFLGHSTSGRNSPATSRRDKRRSELTVGALDRARLARSRTAESLRSNANGETGEEGASGERWVTPMTSPPKRTDRAASPASHRASSRLSFTPLRSGAGRDLSRETLHRNAVTEDGVLAPLQPESPTRSNPVGDLSNGSRTRAARTTTVGSRRITSEDSSDVRKGLSRASSNETWYPQTPERHAHRSQPNGGGLNLTRQHRRAEFGQGEDGSSSINMASIRGMDKLEIFFKYTAVKADLEKAEVERDALLDALNESRAAVDDIRGQREGLEDELQKHHVAHRQLQKLLGSDSDSPEDHLEELKSLKRKWEERARLAEAATDRAMREIDALRHDLASSEEREEQLERENITIGARLAVLDPSSAAHHPLYNSSIRERTASSYHNSRSNTLDAAFQPSSPRQRSVKTNTSSRKSYLGSSPNEGPRRMQSEGNLLSTPVADGFRSGKTSLPSSPSAQLSRRASGSDLGHKSPSAQIANSYLSRSPNLGLTSPSLPLFNEAEIGDSDGLGQSPLMSQTMAFGPKSSYGSNASPLKERAATYRARGQLNSYGLPNGSFESLLPAEYNHKGRRVSTASSDYGEHLPPPVDNDWNPKASLGSSMMGQLKEEDEKFLNDLSIALEEGPSETE